GEKFWSVSLYSTFLQVSRSTKQYKFLMLFLVMTIGMGGFSASAARTINTNLEEQLLYKNGAEISLDVRWDSTHLATSTYQAATEAESDNFDTETEPVVYTEPPFEPIANLSQVENATKVFKKDNVTVSDGARSVHYPSFIAIETWEYGVVDWFNNSVMTFHLFEFIILI